MIRPVTLAAIARGEVDLAFRRWERPRVVVGTRMRTAVGLVEVTSVDRVAVSRITAADARRAGTSLAELRRLLETRAEHPAWRVGLSHAGEDPRVALRNAVPTAEEVADLRTRLDRLDRAAQDGPWTRAALAIIARRPTVRAPDLAAELGRETVAFKRDVRKLKELGLTESLDIGYRISPRGAAVIGTEAAAPSGTSWPRLGAPATRALRTAGFTTLESLDGASDSALAALHGVGPVALDRLREAMASAGLTLRP